MIQLESEVWMYMKKFSMTMTAVMLMLTLCVGCGSATSEQSEPENTSADLWQQVEQWKTEYEWVDLSREVSEDTPHWTGFPAMKVEPLYHLEEDGFNVNTYTLVNQYGTHVDAPIHFVADTKYLGDFTPKDMVFPLCVIDKSAEAAENADYIMTVDDIKAWEAEYGEIPEGAFVAMRTDWSKRAPEDMNNFDEDGNKHYPGWSVEALQYLVEERNVGSIGHETSDTDAPILSSVNGYEAETYFLSQNLYQVEFMTNLSEVPATGSVIYVTFPNVKDASGFTARCFAICPKAE